MVTNGKKGLLISSVILAQEKSHVKKSLRIMKSGSQCFTEALLIEAAPRRGVYGHFLKKSNIRVIRAFSKRSSRMSNDCNEEGVYRYMSTDLSLFV